MNFLVVRSQSNFVVGDFCSGIRKQLAAQNIIVDLWKVAVMKKLKVWTFLFAIMFNVNAQLANTKLNGET